MQNLLSNNMIAVTKPKYALITVYTTQAFKIKLTSNIFPLKYDLQEI